LLFSLALHLPLLYWAALDRDPPSRQWQPFHVRLVAAHATHGSRAKQPPTRPEAPTPPRRSKAATTPPPSAKAPTATSHSTPGAIPQRAALQRVDDAPTTDTKPTVAAKSGAASRPQGWPAASSLEEQKAAEELNEQSLLAAVRLALARHFHYPRMAMRRGWQGEVILAFHLQADGTIVNARIAQSSGYSVLDRAALKALDEINRIGHPLRGDHAMQLPVIYRLEG
jgi:protein TonB